MFDTASRGAVARVEAAVDEHDKAPEQERDEEQRDERFERPLTQRELVRASLLRCPPQEAENPPRH
jgi:hypothetical protein